MISTQVWVYEECEDRQKNQFKGDFINRNAGAFEAAFDDAEGCAVVVNGCAEIKILLARS